MGLGDKKILFAEVGYASNKYCMAQPGQYPIHGCNGTFEVDNTC